jgi:PAS domain-containing protein
VFDNATSAIALLDPEGFVLEINRAGTGLTAAGVSLIGAPLWAAPWLGVDMAASPTATDPLKAAIATAAAGQAAKLAVELTRDGAPLPIDVRLTPIRDEAGAVVYVLAEGRFDA